MSDYEILRQFVKERNDACSSFDLVKFKAFFRKYRGDKCKMPSDEVLEITMRKMVVNIEPKLPQYEEAKNWLLERGHDLEIM